MPRIIKAQYLQPLMTYRVKPRSKRQRLGPWYKAVSLQRIKQWIVVSYAYRVCDGGLGDPVHWHYQDILSHDRFHINTLLEIEE